MKFVTEFKKFISRGNVVDLAVAVIIGGAFGKIVSSLVADILMPFLSLLLGGGSLKMQKIRLGGTEKAPIFLNYGNFIQTTIDFLVIALAIFLMLKLFMAFKRKEEAAPPPAPPPTPEDVVLLREIRDLLKRDE